ncbi:hypothetical protein N0B44_05615 [Roseibacterium beibuensis]|uniref:Uncharacterized protein n=1 Tax=[Roseibacterium] beibuensis TaxID=1193142 RepID=A0ABP9KS85_9RHOB|nr:hypothetical protein [Roseibacterium beibuensis]MCS6622383.1 hypothetical protein [Roseibacterium beibuensis]
MTTRLILASAVALALPMAASAQSALERMEAMSETMTEMTYTALVAEIPALQGNLPTAEWDDEMRAAGECILDGVEDEVGEDGVNEMLDNMEAAMASATPEGLMQGTFQPALPDGITDQQMQAISNECGMVEIMMMRMAESGAMSIMMESGQ